MVEWQDIATAPQDGTLILVSGLNWGKGPERHYNAATWDIQDGCFRPVDDEAVSLAYLTHWMPLDALPDPPESGR